MLRAIPSLLILLALGCRTADKDLSDGTLDTGGLSGVTDGDGDGYDSSEDCDDEDAQTHPGSAEVCDGIDNNCDGLVDEGVTTTYYEDSDGDGFGDSGSAIEACEAPDGYVPNGNDCDDTTAQTFPGAPEACDGEDNDCDGEIDEDVLDIWYADTDGDGFGDADGAVEDCNPGKGFVANSDDCDDSRDDVSPDSEEVCDEVDNDCDTLIDEDVTPSWYSDTDGDGFGDADDRTDSCEQPTGTVSDDTDCDDSSDRTYPGAAVADSTTECMRDADEDGYGDSSPPSGVTAGTDCDDSSAAAFPTATEICDLIDNDCDGDIDEGVTSTWYADDDSDSYGDVSDSYEGCSAPSGYVTDDTDCDDAEALANPGETEVCDEIDNDCDGSVDEGVTPTWYTDADSDGFGDADDSTDSCSQPTGTVSDDTDCDDTDSGNNPDATEICDEEDNDCDGSIDEGVTSIWYADDDGDSYGDASDSYEGCSAPSGHVTDDTDCDDAEVLSNPGETEVCDEIDNDCDGSVDEGVAPTWYADDDGDGFGDASDTIEACEQPSGYVSVADDCDDTDADVNPDELEECDYVDEDCDGSTDEDFRTGSKYTDLNNCGYCGNDCEGYSYDNAEPFCDTALSTPACDF
ncbi:MAG: hypothetical protein ACI8S6_002717, partial [Myxococcota bacterium]